MLTLQFLIDKAVVCIALLLAVWSAGTNSPHARQSQKGEFWIRHTIDDSSMGADGVRLADVSGDGLPDITTGWEEGGVIRVYLNPGPKKSKDRWPAVTVGKVRSPEDAVFADLDGDGSLDVVSSCEGTMRTMFAHWAPGDRRKQLDASAWTTEPIPATKDKRRWMYALPMQVDGKNGIDLIAGSKDADAQVGWLESPASPRELAAWKWHTICDAGWIMSLEAEDVDSDGDLDVVMTDRKGPLRGCYWLENPGARPDQMRPWKRHSIGGIGKEVMFLSILRHGIPSIFDVFTLAKEREVLFLRRQSPDPDRWESFSIDFPQNTGRAKGIAVGDIDLDRKIDLVISCESADGDKSGIFWMKYRKAATDRDWVAYDVSAPEGVKFDRVELLDLDGDGDLDVLTCEESENLGVIWYENPKV